MGHLESQIIYVAFEKVGFLSFLPLDLLMVSHFVVHGFPSKLIFQIAFHDLLCDEWKWKINRQSYHNQWPELSLAVSRKTVLCMSTVNDNCTIQLPPYRPYYGFVSHLDGWESTSWNNSVCMEILIQNEMMWTAGIQMKWVCDHRSESQFKQLRKSPKKRISGLQRDSNNCICLNFDSLRRSHTHFICIPAVHIISFCVSFLSRVDKLNKLAGLQCIGLHSSGW